MPIHYNLLTTGYILLQFGSTGLVD